MYVCLTTFAYPNALEYTIYGFIREFIEQNVWIDWDKNIVIPHDIKIILTKYLKSELEYSLSTTFPMAINL